MSEQAMRDGGPGACGVNRVVAFAHVASVEGSLAFYALLGFEPRSVMQDGGGKAFWARVQSGGEGGGELMFARADGPVDAGAQAVLFYMYSPDVRGLRRHLLANGVRDGAAKAGGAGGTGRGGPAVFEIVAREYMPRGEMRVEDPDGYVILVGELG